MLGCQSNLATELCFLEGTFSRSEVPTESVLYRAFRLVRDKLTSKMIAYTGLDAPMTFNLEDNIRSNFRATLPEGYNPELRMKFFTRLRSAAKYCFNPKKDYRMPTFKSLFLKQINMLDQITDEQWFILTINARVSGKSSPNIAMILQIRLEGRHMLLLDRTQNICLNLKISEFWAEDINLTMYWGSAEEGDYWLMMREPCSSGDI